ncbi:MAG: hypothetical protein ACREJB_12245, partial [Planctomycetaceae bacterium]
PNAEVIFSVILSSRGPVEVEEPARPRFSPVMYSCTSFHGGNGVGGGKMRVVPAGRTFRVVTIGQF